MGWQLGPSIHSPGECPLNGVDRSLAKGDCGIDQTTLLMSGSSAQRQFCGGVFIAFKLRSLAIGTRPRFHVEVEMFVMVIIRLGPQHGAEIAAGGIVDGMYEIALGR